MARHSGFGGAWNLVCTDVKLRNTHGLAFRFFGVSHLAEKSLGQPTLGSWRTHVEHQPLSVAVGHERVAGAITRARTGGAEHPCDLHSLHCAWLLRDARGNWAICRQSGRCSAIYRPPGVLSWPVRCCLRNRSFASQDVGSRVLQIMSGLYLLSFPIGATSAYDMRDIWHLTLPETKTPAPITLLALRLAHFSATPVESHS